MSQRRRLSEAELQAAVAGLEGWSVQGGRLEKSFRLASFTQALELVNRVARVAEAMNHHPDIAIHYRTVGFQLWTHDVGGISPVDVELARRIDEQARGLLT